MLDLTSITSMRAACAGRRIGFVPTMGFLHRGHLALVAEARRRADVVAMSVFVNPLQFGPTEDFAAYPRDAARDRALAAAAGVELLWAPPADAMYPAPPAVTVAPGDAGGILEGAIRPGHFTGVLTVVLKLFQVVQPAVAVFGRKDAQQVHLVRAMVRDFNLPLEVVTAPTVRDPDGLALSSRNVYLTPPMRAVALGLPRALGAGVAAFRAGERRAGAVIAAAYRELAAAESSGGLIVEYLTVLDADAFLPSHAAGPRSILAGAVRIGPRRLIDNVVLGEGLEADPRLADAEVFPAPAARSG